MKQFENWGVNCRGLKLARSGGYGVPVQHEKAWVCDRCFSVLGAMNATTNSARNCGELLHVTRAAEVIDVQLRRFEELWNKAQAISFTSIVFPPKIRTGGSSKSVGLLSTVAAAGYYAVHFRACH